MRTKTIIKGFEISAGQGFEVEKWSYWRYAYRVKVKNLKTGAVIYFRFYDNVNNYEQGKNMLDDEGLKNAFQCFLNDALAGYYDFQDFISSFGYEEKEGFKIWQAVKEQKERAKKLGLDYEELVELINEIENN